MTDFDLVSYQKFIEKTYSKKHLKDRIIEDLKTLNNWDELVNTGIEVLNKESKNSYLTDLSFLDEDKIQQIVVDLFILVASQERETFQTTVGKFCTCLGLDEKAEAVGLAAEIVAVLTDTDFYRLEQKGKLLWVVTEYYLEDDTKKFIENAQYLPPMVVKPNLIKSNYDSTHLTQKEWMILGGVKHYENICVNHLNRVNKIPLSLNKRLLTTFSEKPKKLLTNQEQKIQWTEFVERSYQIYKDLIQLGNQFYITNKVDKRGRTYSQGYHVNPQGNSFRKAIIEFNNQELINGDL